MNFRSCFTQNIGTQQTIKLAEKILHKITPLYTKIGYSENLHELKEQPCTLYTKFYTTIFNQVL